MRRRLQALLGWTLLLAVLAGIAAAGHTVAFRSSVERLHDQARRRLDMITAGLQSELGRFDFLPALLEATPEVQRLLDQPEDTALRSQVDRRLNGINAMAGSANLMVLDHRGVVVAASEGEPPGMAQDSAQGIAPGKDLSSRPHVKDALAQGRGRHYGVLGAGTRPAYHLSYAIYQAERQHGVAAVKVDLSATEQGWRLLPGKVMLVDEHGVVILATDDAWRYRALAPMSAGAQAQLEQQRPYGSDAPERLDWRGIRRWSADAEQVRLSGHDVLATSRVLAPMPWRLIVLDDLSTAFAAARRGALATTLAAGAALALALLVWQRGRVRRLERAHEQALQASRDSLDSKVSERTLALRAANVTLRNELEARKAIEEDLRATQNQLVHVGKMAVLGQMSGAVVDELGAPLQTLRAMVDEARDRLRQGPQGLALTPAQAGAELARMAQLAAQLGRLTQQLRAFAERHDEPRVPVPLRHAITNAQFEVSSRLREGDVMMEVQVQPPALAVLAEESRLEQVLVNLIGNAIDAMANAPVRHVKVDAGVHNGRCVITIGDTGPGIRPSLLPRLFEPFTTSRPPGTGLDLGMMLAAHIVLESGGSLRASNLQGGGACVVIELPLAKSREMALHE